ncbi:MAG: hypothetical protein IJ858_00865 [Acidaminococcaceae bacterium]|nr:hypothetical protein [Acidaminococcaceae bacterium]MBR2181970.1 hypothetical protein [Acidaminococcaceae bacterium]
MIKKERFFGILMGLFLLIISPFIVCAAPTVSSEAYKPQSAVNETQNWPIAAQYQNKGEIWPPVAGRYERKNPNGLANAFIHVAVLPDQWPVIDLHGCDYNGPADEHGWEALDTNPGIWLGGTIQPAQMGLAVRFVIGAKTIGIYRGNGIAEALPPQQFFMMNSVIKSLKDRIVIDYSGECPKNLPDIRGEYVLSKDSVPMIDEYSAFALVESLGRNDTKTDFFDKSLQIIPAPITDKEAADYDKLIGDYSFDDFAYTIKVFKNGMLLRTFIVTHDLSAVYRFESDGNGVMIYNIDGSKG